VLKPIPENRFCLFGREGVAAVPASRGDEVDRVIAIPMLEAMLPFEEFGLGRGAFAKPL
jgi:hypothetical protein